jgi:hypothetical protein
MAVQSLFAGTHMLSLAVAQEERVKQRVLSLPPNQLLNASEQDLIDSLVDEYRFNVPVLDEDASYIADSNETRVDARLDPKRMVVDRSRPCPILGNRHVIAVPFNGDAGLFKVRPHIFQSGRPQAEIGVDELRLTFIRTDHDAEALSRDYQREMGPIRDYLRSLRESADQFNLKLLTLVKSEITKRKNHLLANAAMTAALNLPLKRREGVPQTYAVPLTKRRPRIDEIKVTGVPFKPEPALSDDEYEAILSIIKNMVAVMERSPRAFATIQEEDLRTHFLFQLNGQYEGMATGETFNFRGRTDIFIPFDGRNVFIAECKFWSGEKAFLETISQLLSYLSWRDTKTAILVFNRNKDHSAVLKKIASAVRDHILYKRVIYEEESTFRYVFGQPNDPNREVTITVLAFDVPIEA